MIQTLMLHVQNNEKSSTRIPEKKKKLILKRKKILTQEIYIFQVRTVEPEYFKSFFFSASLEEWFRLDPSLRNSGTINTFKQKLLPFICSL